MQGLLRPSTTVRAAGKAASCGARAVIRCARMSEAVLITGAAGGIGLACARALAGAGALVLQDLDAHRLAAAQQTLAGEGIRAQTHAGDLCDAAHLAALAAAVERAGGLRPLAHTAGLSPTMGDARRGFEVDLVGTGRLREPPPPP